MQQTVVVMMLMQVLMSLSPYKKSVGVVAFSNHPNQKREMKMEIQRLLHLRNRNAQTRLFHTSRIFSLSSNSKSNSSTSNRVIGERGRSSFLFQRDYKYETSLSSSVDNENNESSNDNVNESDVKINKYQNKNNINDQIFSAISANGEMKVTATTVRNIVNDVMIQQSLTATPADVLSRSMTCGLLLSNGMQVDQSFQLTLKCDGPIRNVVSISKSDGTVKGYVGNPSLGDMHISEAVGKGTVQVVKNHPEWPNPYNGITAMEHGDVDRDVGIYLAESEQRSCALAAATKINGVLCVAAGGYVVEQLPFCSKETVEKVEQNLEEIVKKNGSEHAVPAGLFLNGATPYDICSMILKGLDMQPLDQLTPKLVCGCSAERLFRAVRLLPREEVDKILEEEEQIEARCHFCGKVYRMGPNEVRERFAAATGDPSLDSDFNEGEE